MTDFLVAGALTLAPLAALIAMCVESGREMDATARSVKSLDRSAL